MIIHSGNISKHSQHVLRTFCYVLNTTRSRYNNLALSGSGERAMVTTLDLQGGLTSFQPLGDLLINRARKQAAAEAEAEAAVNEPVCFPPVCFLYGGPYRLHS